MASPLFANAIAKALESQIACFSVAAKLNGVDILAIPDDSEGRTTLGKGGFEEQDTISITFRKSDYEAIQLSNPSRQDTVEIDGEVLLVNTARTKAGLPYVTLECVRYR